MANDNILISLEHRHAENILAGNKRVELRRRAIRVEPGTIIWMYSKLPKGLIVGSATVVRLRQASPASLWRRYGRETGITRSEFFEYFSATGNGFALELSGSTRLKEPVSLKALREVDKSFQPPQFFKRLHPSEEILKAVSSAI